MTYFGRFCYLTAAIRENEATKGISRIASIFSFPSAGGRRNA